MADAETPVVYNTEHHLGGLNVKFFADADELCSKFAGPEGIFDSEQREIVQHAQKIFATFLLGSALPDGRTSMTSMRVCDLGAGTGILSKVLSTLVGKDDGVVFASDISPGFVTLLEKAAADGVHSNIVPVLGSDKEVEMTPDGGSTTVARKIDAHSLDVVFVCDVYHHMEYPRTMMASIKKLLKPDVGRLWLVDFYRDPGRMVSHPPQWALDHLRAGKEEFSAEIVSCGFRVVMDRDLDELRENYLICFAPVEQQ